MAMKARLKLDDMQGAKYSHFEVMSAINDAWMMLWMALAERYSSITRKLATVPMTDGRAYIPEDFYTLADDTKGVKVAGLELVGDQSLESVELDYYCIPPEVTHPNDEVAVPRAVELDCIEMVAAIVQGNSNSAVSLSREAARRLSQNREFVRIPDRVAFP